MKKLATVRVDEVKVPTTYSLEQTGITQGLTADFATCRQRFLFRINGWRQMEQFSEPLFFGSLVHHLLEELYKSQSKLFSAVIPKLIRLYAAKHAPDVDPVLLLKAEALMTVYCEVFTKEQVFPIRTEEVFATPALGVMLRGRKDLVYKNKFGKKWMKEHKTKSQIDHEFLGYQLSHDIQNFFYDLSEEVEHGSPFVGITYNILKRPMHRPKKEETEVEFLQRLKTEIRKNSGDFFFRYEVIFTKQDRARFRGELELKIFEMKEYLAGRLGHYRNEAACLIPYRCQFLRACSSGYMTGYQKSKIIFPELEE